MEQKLQWLRYLSPLVGIIFCPVTILFIWSLWTAPIEGEFSIPYSDISQ